VEPEWVCQQGDQVLVVDVREPEEVRLSMLGEIAGARVMPLSSLRDRLHEVPRDRPVVLVCPAGARSAIAASILEQAGVERVASLRGGLIEWGLLGLPLLR
jgi:rhodanese-related sulfurtransferase